MVITQSSYQSLQAPKFQKLSNDQLTRIHAANLEILERTGVRLHLPEAVKLLKDAGADVTEGNRVRVPSHLVEWALRVAPKLVVLANRYGERVMPLERNNVFYGPGSDCPNVIDIHTGEPDREPCKTLPMGFVSVMRCRISTSSCRSTLQVMSPKPMPISTRCRQCCPIRPNPSCS